MTTTHSPSSTGLATRLLAGQAIVLVAGALTVGLVAAVIGPPIFHQHLLEAGHQQNSPELVHIEMAYRDSSLISVGIGLLISLLDTPDAGPTRPEAEVRALLERWLVPALTPR